ncbi:MAG: prolyl oligopeptidase family serine peptidase [Caulobacterales bacterium]
MAGLRRFAWFRVAFAGLCLALGLGVARAAPPTARDFARDAAIWGVSISPDGRHIAALTSPDGDTVVISVWRTEATGEKPVVLGATHMRFLAVSFLKNDRLIVTAVQPLTTGSTRGHIIKQYVTDLEGKSWTTLLPEARAGQSEDAAFVDRLVDAALISRLPLDPQRVLVTDNRLEGRGDVYAVNIYTGSAERIEQGSERFFDYQADLKGQLRAKRELNYDGDKVYIAQWIKDPATGKWAEHFRSYAKDRSETEVVAFTTDPNILYVTATPNGADKTAIYEYDIAQRKLLDPVFAHKLFEAGGRVYQSHAAADYGRVLGFSYDADSTTDYWVDDKLAAIAKAVSQAMGVTPATIDWVDPGTGVKASAPVASGVSVRFISWSDDLAHIIVEKSGPRQPPEYYLLTDGAKLSLLGKARPWITAADLGDTRLVEYAARDGLMIPAFLTLPSKALFGSGPYPTLVEPHGGPWARDELEWDEVGWVQYFATRGYAVLQPQFRGSQGWGQKLWRAGDGEWGQKMQDDKDDGVKWLVAQHIADPTRVAMFGYSYGGYAALAASIRPDGLYQCAISGAGAGDLAALKEATFDNRFEREFQNPTIRGLDALQHAKEAKIPVLLYHGDRDQTVDVEESRKFAAALKAAGRPFKLVEIKDMGHQYVFMTPAMLEEQLGLVDNFLKSDCKPGGL